VLLYQKENNITIKKEEAAQKSTANRKENCSVGPTKPVNPFTDTTVRKVNSIVRPHSLHPSQGRVILSKEDTVHIRRFQNVEKGTRLIRDKQIDMMQLTPLDLGIIVSDDHKVIFIGEQSPHTQKTTSLP
jgi:hypothetical protein